MSRKCDQGCAPKTSCTPPLKCDPGCVPKTSCRSPKKRRKTEKKKKKKGEKAPEWVFHDMSMKELKFVLRQIKAGPTEDDSDWTEEDWKIAEKNAKKVYKERLKKMQPKMPDPKRVRRRLRPVTTKPPPKAPSDFKKPTKKPTAKERASKKQVQISPKKKKRKIVPVQVDEPKKAPKKEKKVELMPGDLKPDEEMVDPEDLQDEEEEGTLQEIIEKPDWIEEDSDIEKAPTTLPKDQEEKFRLQFEEQLKDPRMPDMTPQEKEKEYKRQLADYLERKHRFAESKMRKLSKLNTSQKEMEKASAISVKKLHEEIDKLYEGHLQAFDKTQKTEADEDTFLGEMAEDIVAMAEDALVMPKKAFLIDLCKDIIQGMDTDYTAEDCEEWATSIQDEIDS